MRSITHLVVFGCLLAAALFRPGFADAAEPALFQIGKVQVWAIADAIAERDISVFVAEPDVVKQYVPSGKYQSGVLCFLLKNDDDLVLIDTGNGNPPGNARASLLMDGIRHIGIEPGQIGTVILTHMHGDHIGGLVWEGKPAFPNALVKVGRIEQEFWLSDKSYEQFPDRKANFDRAKKIMEMYEGRVEDFEFGAEVVPGLTALDSRGHTPGHTAFLLESAGEKLLCVGDLLHSAALHFVRPDINAIYDMDPLMSKMSRREFLNKAAWENLPIAGMHLPFPGIGTVKQEGPEGFTYHPGL